MWAIQRNKMVGPDMMQTIYYSAPRVLGGCSWFGPTQSLVDSYQCKDGLSILESPLYDPENPWLNRDPRLAMTACLPGTRAMGVQYEMDCTIAEVANYNALDASGNPTTVPNADANPKVNKYEYAANNTKGPGGFYCRKFYDPVYVADGSITDRGFDIRLCIDEQQLGIANEAGVVTLIFLYEPCVSFTLCPVQVSTTMASSVTTIP